MKDIIKFLNSPNKAKSEDIITIKHNLINKIIYFNFNSGWNFGDPHITTLDGRSYTFNGLGEYVITRITGHFELQARTTLATSNTTNSTATIFSAIAMGGHGRDSELKERVQVYTN